MSIDWEKEVSHRSDELINDLSELVSIDSSRDTEHKTSDFPLGPGPAKALQTFLHFAERDGFKTKNVDNLAGRIELVIVMTLSPSYLTLMSFLKDQVGILTILNLLSKMVVSMLAVLPMIKALV
jgi:Acetylornithine deacetylase/Succinyl-diaminopimelate desuccinylase and related deacylases